jgi:hypothetical protein
MVFSSSCFIGTCLQDVNYAGVAPRTASAVLFDPKDDDMTLAGTRKPWETKADAKEGNWVEVKRNSDAATQEEVQRLVRVIKTQRWAQFYPRLYRIVGPDEKTYGYLFTAWNRAVVRSDNRTFSVLLNEMPPHIQLLR